LILINSLKACGDYNADSDKCKILPPLAKTPKPSSSNKKDSKNAPQMKYLTPVFLVIDLLSNLGGDVN